MAKVGLQPNHSNAVASCEKVNDVVVARQYSLQLVICAYVQQSDPGSVGRVAAGNDAHTILDTYYHRGQVNC